MAGKIKIGVFGCWRGSAIAKCLVLAGAEITAVCDRNPEMIEKIRPYLAPDAGIYSDFDEFIEHNMDGCLLTNFYCEHAPYAVRLLERNISVLSEVAGSITMAESVALVRATKKSKGIYMLAENYPFSAPCQELRRIYKSGTLGRVVYAEGEYVHPMSEQERNYYAPGIGHWRNYIPSTYYNTHALGPLMYATEAMPLTVCAQSVFRPEINRGSAARNDPFGMMMCRMDDGSVFTFSAWAAVPGHGNWYRVTGTLGVAETVRYDGKWLRVQYEKHTMPSDKSEASVYIPSFPCDDDKAAKAGHGGGDYFVAKQFVESLEGKYQPFFDVYRATAMASVGILGWRSCLEDGRPYRIPDFRNEADCLLYENDTASPFPDENGICAIPCSVNTNYTPSDEDITVAKKYWGVDKKYVLPPLKKISVRI